MTPLLWVMLAVGVILVLGATEILLFARFNRWLERCQLWMRDGDVTLKPPPPYPRWWQGWFR